jgi:hypothetical protein
VKQEEIDLQELGVIDCGPHISYMTTLKTQNYATTNKKLGE